MRNLTVIREKSSTAALSSVRIYAEDHYIPDIYINKVPCRTLGKVKNGESATFKINEKAARIFAVRGKSTRNCFNDCISVDEGEFDVTLSGKVSFDISRGNCFKFNGETDHEIEELRSKAKRKLSMMVLGLISIIMSIIMIISMNPSSWIDPNRDVYTTPQWNENASPKAFGVDGMAMLLTTDFSASSNKSFAAIYSSSKVTVFVVEERFSDYPEFKDYTLKQYAEKIIQANKLENTEVKEEDGKHFFIFEANNSQTGEPYTYYGYVFKTDHACWFIHFAVKSDELEECRDNILEWADSITFQSAQ